MMHPHRMHVRHQLLPQEARPMQFAHWLINRCAQSEEFRRLFVIGEDAGFVMNGRVSSHNIRVYVAAGKPPEFNSDVNVNRAKLNVWIGLSGNGQIIEPIFFIRNVDGLTYL